MALTKTRLGLDQREAISRGLAVGDDFAVIARRLGRPTWTGWPGEKSLAGLRLVTVAVPLLAEAWLTGKATRAIAGRPYSTSSARSAPHLRATVTLRSL